MKALSYFLPFVLWLSLQAILPETAAAYALRSACTLIVLAAALACALRRNAFRPPSGRACLWGLAVGVLVAVLWIAPECSAAYRVWCVLPFGSDAAPTGPSPYDPAVCGWPLTWAKLVGSAFAIAPAEELFFRAFLYRRLQSVDFESVPHARFDPSAFLWVVFLFTLEHDRPLAAACAGVLYGFVYLRAGLWGAVVAHVTTNLLLALHVIRWGAWGFW